MKFIKNSSIIIKLMVVSSALLTYFECYCGADTFEYYINTKENGTPKYHGDYSGGTSFDNSDIGNNINLNTSNLIIDLAGLKTWNNSGDLVINAKLFYRVYLLSSTPGSFIEVNLPLYSESGNNREWQNDTDVNLLSGLTTTGTYIVEIYYQAEVDPASGDNYFIYRSNSSNNYKANFDVATALPIELTNFFVVSIGSSTTTFWSTATELNNSHFDIQRSADSKNWETIGTVQGNGTTLEPQEYRYTDRQPLPGINYYRLKQVDYDGQYEYSKVVSVDFGMGTRPGVLSPNPVGSELFLTLPEETDGAVSVAVFDMNGRIWQQKDNIRTSLDVSGLPQGIYFVKLVAENGRVLLQERFVKE